MAGTLALVIPASSFAQDSNPAWVQNLTCTPDLQKYHGIAYCTAPAKRATVIVVDLKDPYLRIEYVLAPTYVEDNKAGDGHFEPCFDVNRPEVHKPGCRSKERADYYPVMSLLNAVPRFPDTAAVIAIDYGAGTQDGAESRRHGPEGFTVIQGKRIDGPANGDDDNNAVRRPWLGIGSTAPLQVEFGQFVTGQDNGGKAGWIYTGIGGAPWLIQNGVVADDEISECRNAEMHSCVSEYAQTAVAVSKDRRYLFWVVVSGVNASGIATFTHDSLDASEAIKLDGGGSSQLWYGGLPGQSDADRIAVRGDGRYLSQFAAIIAKPGNGINLGPPVLDMPSPVLSTLFKGIQEWLSEQWDGVQRSAKEWWQREIVERWNDMSEDMQQKIVEWWEQFKVDAERQIQEYVRELDRRANEWVQNDLPRMIDQTCGAALAPGVIACLWVFSRRRQIH